MLNSTFLLIHGWNVKDSDFSVDSYPPTISRSQFMPGQLKLDPNDPFFIDDDLNSHELVLNGGNNGFWSASLISLFNYSFEFDNVGHLVGKLRFLTTQGAFLSAIGTDQVASPTLKRLKEAPLKLLNRVPGTKIEEKQTFIFSNGIPWSKSDINENEQQSKNDTAEAGLREAYRQLNDDNLLRGGDLMQSFFSGEGEEGAPDFYNYERYKDIRDKVKGGVQRAANAVRDIFNNFGHTKRTRAGFIDTRSPEVGRAIIPSNKSISDYDVPELDSSIMGIRNLNEDETRDLWGIAIRTTTSKRSQPAELQFVARSEAIARPQIVATTAAAQRNAGLKLVAYFPKKSENNNGFGSNRGRATYSDGWDAFLRGDAAGAGDLRNYYYNTILLNVANNDPDKRLAFVPPEGYGVIEDNGIKRIVADGFPGDLDQKANFDFLMVMPRGQLIDEALKSTTEKFTAPPTPQSMPDFGKNLQQSIFTRFNDPNNLNHINFRDDSVLEKNVRETIQQTSTLSIPTLVSAPDNPVPTNLPKTAEEAAKIALFVINFVNRVSETKTGQPLGPPEISTIEVPNGYTVTDDNVYTFLQPVKQDTTESKADKNLTITVNQRLIGGGDSNFFVSSKLYIMSNGYCLRSDRPNPVQDFRDGVTTSMLREEEVFIPDIGNLMDSDADEEIKNLILSIKDFAGDTSRISSIYQQGELGQTGNIDVEIDGRNFNVVMRPTYYFLGSVLEAISEQLNGTVKFYYKPVPSAASNLTIPIPENRIGSEIQKIDSEIFDLNKEIVMLGGQPEPQPTEPRQKYLTGQNRQTKKQEELAAVQVLDEIVKWSVDFSNYMRTELQNIVNSGVFTPNMTKMLDLNVVDNDGNSTVLFRRKDGVGVSRFSTEVMNMFAIKQNRVNAASFNSQSVGSGLFLFKLDSPIFGTEGGDGQFTAFPAGVYTINAAVDSISFVDPALELERDEDGRKSSRAQEAQFASRNFIRNFIRNNKRTSQANNGRYFPTANDLLRVPTQVADKDKKKVENLQRSVISLQNERNSLGFEDAFDTLKIKTTFEIPVNIGAIEQILTTEQRAPTHSMLKKIISAASDTLPQLTLTLTPLSKDPSYIEVAVFSTNIDGVITEVMTELDANLLSGESIAGTNSVEQLRRSVERVGGQNSYLQSEKIMVCNFGTINSLVENFQMSSKVDSNAFNTFRVPSMMGGVSLDISNVLGGGRLETSGILNDIVDILNTKNGKIGGSEELKELRIVNADGQVDDIGLNVLTEIFTNQNDPIIRKSAEGLIQDLMSQDVKFYSKILALQSEYFDGLSPQQKTSNNLQEGERFAGSRFYGNILNNFLRTVTLTIHGTTNLTTFNYIYLKGLLQGVEGIYQIKSVNESITPTSFTTTIECGLVEYTQNDPTKNPLAYRGVGSLRRLAQINRGLRLDTGSDDATISVPDFAEIVFEAEKEDGYKG